MKNKPTAIERREFIKLISVLTAGMGISLPMVSCGSSGGNPEKVQGDLNAFDLLRILREGTRKSPDFLAARYKELVESKNPDKIFEWVRDHIQTLPNEISSKRIPKNGKILDTPLRWGIDGMLRYGAGTFYEKAALLQKMLAEAGFQAEMRKGDFDIDAVGWEKVFFTKSKATFRPDVPQKIIDGALKKQQKRKTIKTVDLNDKAFQDTLSRVMENLPSDLEFPDMDWKSITETMFEVELLGGAQKKVALNPNIATAKKGDTFLLKKGVQTSYKESFDNVSVSLSMAHSESPYEPVAFAQGEVPMNKLFQSQLKIAFKSSLDTKSLLRATRKMVRSFTPVIHLQGVRVTDDDMKAYTFWGKSLDLNGDILEVKDDQLLVNGQVPEMHGENPAQRAKVAALGEPSLHLNSFPHVELHFNPLDDAGNIVEDLETLDFSLTENGEIAPFRVTKNKEKAPNILLLLDYSGSIPSSFREDGAAELVDKLVAKTQTLLPNATFKIAIFDKDRVVSKSVWNKNKDGLLQAVKDIKRAKSSGSDLWKVLTAANNNFGADMVVFITDGVATDKLTDSLLIDLKAGCPAVLIGVGKNPKIDVLQIMAAHTKGIAEKAENHEEAVGFVYDFINKNPKQIPYKIAYTSHFGEPVQRKVALHIRDKKNIRAEASYDAPEKRPGTIAPCWSGIYLTLSYKHETIERCLAGLSLVEREAEGPVLPTHIEDVEAALFGDYSLNIEGSEPTIAVLMDEVIQARLSYEPLAKALDKSEEDMVNALKQGILSFPHRYFGMNAPFASDIGEDYVIFPSGIKATLHGFRPRPGDGLMINTIDILPLSTHRTLHKDPKIAFRKTLERSLMHMNLEAKNSTTSSFAILSEKELTIKNAEEISLLLRDLSSEKNSMAWKQLRQMVKYAGPSRDGAALYCLSKDGTNDAYMLLDANTGNAFSVLYNGTGGAITPDEVARRFKVIDKVLTILGIIFSIGEAIPLFSALGLWVALMKIEATHIGNATIAMASLGSGETPDLDIDGDLHDSLCDALANGLSSLGGTPASVANLINDSLSLAFDKSLVSGCTVLGYDL